MKCIKALLISFLVVVAMFANEKEIISKRTFTSKTFVAENGQYKQIVYPHPIHYLENGQYIPIPEGDDLEYYTELAVSQLNMMKNNSSSRSLAKSINNSSLGAWGTIWLKDNGNESYMNDNDSPFELGINYYDSDNWYKYRILDGWLFQNLELGYVIDSTIYKITISSATVSSGDLTIQWMFADWYYNWNSDPQQEYNAIGNGEQLGSITLTNDITTTQTKKIKWNSGSGLSDSLQKMIDLGNTNFSFYSGLKTNRESSNQYNLATVQSQAITIYYTPPKKPVYVDNCIFSSSTSVGGNLETTGILPPGTNQVNSAGSNIVLYKDSSYTISEPEDLITYNNVDYRHHSWKENTSDYELNHDFATYENTDEQIGYFKEPESVSITKQYGDEAIEIKDPWWKDPATNQRHNPPIYQTLFGSSYNVFLNQNPDDGPHYRLKVPHIGQVTGSDIYVFDHWEASIIDGDTSAVFNLRGDITTKNRETDVVFKQAGATVTAVYEPVNQIANYTLNIPTDETMNIPAGANISFAEVFTFNVKGEISAIGTDASSIELIPASSDPSFEW
jgi:hypothetical protein